MGFNPFKAAKKVVNKVAKPFRKISQKFIPKEARFALPFLAAATPFMLPAGGFGASGLFSSAAGRGFLSSLANVAGQAGADPEGDDINLLSTILAGGTGALSTPKMGDTLRSNMNLPATTAREAGIMQASGINPGDIAGVGNTGFLAGAENLGREGLAKAADYLSASREGIAGLGADPGSLFSKEGAKGLAKAAAVPFSQGSGDVAKASADKMLRDFEEADAAEQAQIEETTTANESERADLQMTFMRQANIGEDEIQETLEMNDLGEYYTPPTESAANGGIMGRTGFRNGGIDQYKTEEEKFIDKLLATDSTIPTRPTDPRNMTTDEIVAAITSGMSTPEMFQELMLRNSGGVNEMDMGEGKAFSFDERGVNSGGVIEDFLFKFRESNPDIYGEYSRPREFLPTAGPKFYRKESLPVKANGGIIGLKEGGMLNFGGREMDLRTGGFVPIGKKERADDVPARLSKNEFVMTADAVRAAGGGSVNKGAQRMYDVMNKLEARA